MKILCFQYFANQKPALTRVQRPTPAMFLWFVTLTFDLLTTKLTGFQESSWNIFVSSLVILAALFFLGYRAETRTNKHPTPATAVSVDRYSWQGAQWTRRSIFAMRRCLCRYRTHLFTIRRKLCSTQ